jgi:hypothetical protein
MLRRLRLLAILSALLACSTWPTLAETRNEFWPEMDTYLNVSPRVRAFLLAAFVRSKEAETDTGDRFFHDAQFGTHLDITLKPRLRRRMMNADDWERQRYAWIRLGYRYGTSLGDVDDPYRENRGIFEINQRAPLQSECWIVGRLRVDLRDVNGTDSVRYRLRLGFEREMQAAKTVLVPFANAEAFYDSRHDDWGRYRYQAGVEVLLNKRWRVEPSLVYQDDRNSEPAHVNAFAFAVKYYR